MNCLSNGRYIVQLCVNHATRQESSVVSLCTPAGNYYYTFFKVFSSDMSSTGALPDQTQCKWKPVSNNSEQDQCDTVWNTTRRDILCGDHSISWERIYRSNLNAVYSRLFMPKGPNHNI